MAKSKVKKGFFYYLFVFLGLVFGVFCILATILIFNPGQDIYGIGIRFVQHTKGANYYYTTEENEALRTKLSQASYNKVKFTSDYANFNISYNVDEYSTHVVFQPSITALSQTENVDLKLSISVANGVLDITVEEPDIWIGFSKNVNVYLVLPEGANFTNIDFDINTKSGAVQFGDTSNKSYEVKSLNITTETGSIRLCDNLKVVSGTVNIKTQKSRIDIDSNITGLLNIENESGKVDINQMSGSLRVESANTLEVNANKIGGDVYVNSTNGYISIKELGTTITNTGNVIGYVDQTTGQTILGYLFGNFVAEKNLDNTNIIIGKMTGDADIESQSGYVTIEKLGKKADITTTSGNIQISNAYNNIDAVTTYGTINVTQHSNLAKTILISDSGKIIANFTELGAAELTTKGDIDVNVKTGLAFKFVYNAKAISVNWISTQLPLSGFVLVSGAVESTTTIVTANSENGTVTLKDGFVA